MYNHLLVDDSFWFVCCLREEQCIELEPSSMVYKNNITVCAAARLEPYISVGILLAG